MKRPAVSDSLKGNQRAMKGKVPRSAAISVRCTPEQKEEWEKNAQGCNMKLSDWVNAVLDSV